ERPGRTPILRWLLLLTAVPAGCAALHEPSAAPPASATTASSSRPPDLGAAPLRQASFEVPVQQRSPACAATPGRPPLAGARGLSVEALVEQVLARNPSLAQMTAAWQAASARYPQVTSLDDPMFGAMFAPASIGSDNVEFGYRLEVSQRLPFPGKL